MSGNPVATLVLCRWLKNRIAEWESAAKAELSMTAGERKAAAVNGAHLGFVTLARGKRQTSVDEDAFTDWVANRWPTEITQSVRPAFRKKLLDSALKRGALIDGDGEVCDAVEITTGTPYPTCQLSEEAGVTIAGLLAKGALGVNGLREIEGA